MSEVHDRVLLELDCLLDTRLAILNKVSSITAEAAVKSNDYFDRRSDFMSEFLGKDYYPGLDHDFEDAYKGRKVADLQNNAPVPTRILRIIEKHAFDIERIRNQSPVKQYMSLHLNVYPYVLNEEEKEMFIMSLQMYTRLPFEALRVVSLPPEMLTPEYLSANYSQMFTYEPNEWMNLHAEALKLKRIPLFKITAPIKAKEKGLPKDLDNAQMATATRASLSETVGMTLLPLSEFSMDRERIDEIVKE